MAENRLYIEGRIGSDPTLRTAGDSCVCGFSFANTYSWGKGDDKKERTTWFNVSIWGKRGEYASKILKKGMAVMIIGRVQTTVYDKKDGSKGMSVDIVCDDFKCITYISAGDKPSRPEQQSNESAQAPEPHPHFSDDDIPF